MMTKGQQGRKTPSAATSAPANPATRYPTKATVITTGPGVIIATATASRNCRSSSQWKSFTTPPCRKGTMASPLPNTTEPAIVKNQRIFRRTGIVAGAQTGEQKGRRHQDGRGARARKRRAHQHHGDPRGQEDPEHLLLRPGGHHRADQERSPEEEITGQRHPHQLERAAGDDGDDGRADAVEDPLHPGKAAVGYVEDGKRQHHRERRGDESDADERRAKDAGANPPQVDGELRRERSRRQLRERQALDVILAGNPAASLDQVALHVSSEGDGPTKAESAEAQEVEEELPQRAGHRLRGGRGRGFVRVHPRASLGCQMLRYN